MRLRAGSAWLALLALVPVPAAAQQDHALMRSEILDTTTIENEADMDFGDIVPGTSDGTVVMNPGPSATCTTDNGIVHTGTCQAARFEGTLPFVHYLQVTKPAGDQIMLIGPAGATMRLHDFTFAKGSAWMLGGNATEPQYLVIGGSFTLFVGGTLDVARNQRPGVYNGSFELTFNYN